MTTQLTPLIDGHHVTHSGMRFWKCKYTEKQRMNQLSYHTQRLELFAKQSLPPKLRFVLAVRGNMGEVENRMEVCYQATAEMQFEPEWSPDVSAEAPGIDGWLIIGRYVV